MKRMVLYAAVILMATAECSVQEPQEEIRLPEQEGTELLFTAYSSEPETKTTLIQDGTLPDGQPKMITWWSPAEEICIYYGASEGNKFTSTNTELTQKATFRGTLDAFTGENETGVYNYFWAVYPYDAAVRCDGESLVVTLADEQEAVAGSYANKTNVTVAKSPGLSLGFYNVCSFFRFYVEEEGVISATFRGNNNEDVAGTFRVSFGDNGKPTAPTIINRKKEITLRRPNNEPFVVGESYYFILLPQTFENGFTVQFDTEEATGSRVITSRAVFARNNINYGNTAFDHNVTYESFAVDLGLSVKWARCNIGATILEEYGDYYAWGETNTKSSYTRSTYKFGNGTEDDLYPTKYNKDDKKMILDPVDDIATIILGENWRMPTDEEWTELVTECTWTWTDNYNETGIKGAIVSATNGNSIFLPAAGYRYDTSPYLDGRSGYYRSSSRSSDYAYLAMTLSFHYHDYNGELDVQGTGAMGRFYGHSIRAVLE